MSKFAIQKALPIAIATASLSSVSIITIAEEVTTPKLEEIVVTAQKREESLQDVPVAVTAFSGLQLEQAGIETIADLERLSPNTTLRPSRATNTTLTAYIRGIGQNDPLWGFEPGVGVYVDDVYIARPQGAILDVYDVERIEILRGPQGTLYGKNTIGGAIKYVTKKLPEETEASIKAGVGSFNQRDLRVSASTSISETFKVGAAVASYKRDGFGTNNFTGDENYNKDLLAARLSLEWTPSDTVFVRFTADQTIDDSNARQGSRLVPSLVTGAAPDAPFESNAGLAYAQEVENKGGSLTVEWDVSENLAFKSISAYREGSTEGPIDFDATPLNSFDVPARYADDQFTQEFQITYTGERFSVVGGVYYFEGFAAGAFDVVAGAVFGAALATVPGEELGPVFVASTSGDADTTSKAVYFHTAYDLTDDVTLTLGARYTQDEKESTVFKGRFFTDGVSEEFGGTNLSVFDIQSDFTDGDEWNQFSPKIGVDWHASEDTLLYYSYAEGFKSGGVNMRADVAASPAGFSQVFDPEEVKTHELGVKTELGDGRVRLNAAVFTTDYDSVQSTTNRLFGTNFVPLVITDNTQDIQGLELELTAQLTDALSMVFNYGWTDAEWTSFTDFDLAGQPFDNSDNIVVSNTPEHSGLLGFSYTHDMDDLGSLAIGFNVSYTDEIAPEIVRDSLINADAYTLTNLDVTWSSADYKWFISLHGRNLGDKEFLVAGYNFPNFLGENTITGFYGNPRTATLNVGYKF